MPRALPSEWWLPRSSSPLSTAGHALQDEPLALAAPTSYERGDELLFVRLVGEPGPLSKPLGRLPKVGRAATGDQPEVDVFVLLLDTR